jgi:hypothetical protein
MVRLEERLSFSSSHRAKPLCWILFPKEKDLGCRAEPRLFRVLSLQIASQGGEETN